MNQIIELGKRFKVLFSIRTIRGGIEILRSGDLSFLITRLYQILIQTPPDAKEIFAESRRIEILTTKHTLYVAYLIQEHLAAARIDSRILQNLDAATVATVLHIVICPNAFKKLPQHMIAFQMEQTTDRRWFTARYINVLRSKAIAVLDYSLFNIKFLTGHCRISFQKTYYFPIAHSSTFRNRFLPQSGSPIAGLEYELAFYGDVNDRRKIILARLQQHFSILIISECFGVELYQQLARAKAVINIHYYQPALLETTRIYESLALGKRIISECATNQSEYQQGLVDLVDFVDFSDMESAVAEIRRALDSIKAVSRESSQTADSLRITADWSRFYFFRMLAGLQIIDYQVLESVASGAPIHANLDAVCLSLPETCQRRSGAWMPVGRRVEFFDGVRHPLGWVGCALSYKFLATQALKNHKKCLLVYEDDVEPVRLDSRTLKSIEAYLGQIEGEWDVFCGLITDLAESAVISGYHESDGLRFVHLDEMTGTVFNIYSRNALILLSEWTYAGPESTLTIDRYLEANRKLRVVTVYPFVAGHKDGLISTLWGFRNSSYSDWIATSQRRLGEKITAYQSA